jgi:CheY-like chemotaxis protein
MYYRLRTVDAATFPVAALMVPYGGTKLAQVSQHRLTVVDDSPELLAVFGDALRFDGVSVTLFDGSARISDVVDSAPDLLVIDLRLGSDRLTGLEMIRLIRAHRELRRVPIIVCSAALDEIRAYEDELTRIAAVFILPKPFSLAELESCVGEALGERVGASRRPQEPLAVN